MCICISVCVISFRGTLSHIFRGLISYTSRSLFEVSFHIFLGLFSLVIRIPIGYAVVVLNLQQDYMCIYIVLHTHTSTRCTICVCVCIHTYTPGITTISYILLYYTHIHLPGVQWYHMCVCIHTYTPRITTISYCAHVSHAKTRMRCMCHLFSRYLFSPILRSHFTYFWVSFRGLILHVSRFLFEVSFHIFLGLFPGYPILHISRSYFKYI